MKYLKDTTWSEVFTSWRDREAHDPAWIRCATEVKGWPDWESWRRFTASQIDAANQKWQIFEFTDPYNQIPNMLMGPFPAWQDRLAEKNTHTFADLFELPEQVKYFSQEDPKVSSMIDNFPKNTELIGYICEDNRIICIEGHHRSATVALARKLGRPIDFGDSVRIALAKLPAEKQPLWNAILARGTTRNS